MPKNGSRKLKNNIRRKILFPFILITIVFGITATASGVMFLKSTNQSDTMGYMITGFILTYLALCLVMSLIYAIIIRKITSSIDILSIVAEKVSQGDLQQSIHLKSEDEIGRLSQIFNDMIQSLNHSSEHILEEKNRLGSIIACMPHGVIVTDLENRLIHANRHAEKLFNISANKLLGENLLKHIDHQEVVDILNQTVEQENVITRETEIQDKNQQDRIYKLSSTVAFSHTHKAIGIITVLQDITHDKELEELREGFLRTVSHELRTPLTSIVGFLELLKHGRGGSLTESQMECVNVALNESISLKDLIEDLLDLSRLRAGKAQLRISHIPVKNLLESLCQSFRPLADGKGLKLYTKDCPENLKINADMAYIRRILINLISNAIKFTNEGEVVISCYEDPSSVQIRVSDTGIGLMDHEKSIIFERFRQVDYSQTRRYEGIGLGLSIVKQLVELHNGHIEVVSTYGEGSEFSFNIPKNLIAS